MFFCLAFKNTGICGVLCILGPKSIGIYSIFCVFAWLPQKTLKRKNAVNWLWKSEKSSEKCVKTALFSDFRYPPNGGGAGFCSWRRLWATRIPAKKLSPTLLKDFWWFSGPGVGGSAAWGAPHHRALVALGRSYWGYVSPSWGLCWPILGLCWPILELCWPILGLCWPILGPMLAHLEAYVGPCWPILNHKIRKMGKNGKSTKHRKTGTFWRYRRVGGRGGGPSLLRRGEKRRTAMPRPGGPWPDFGLTPLVGSAGPLGPPFHRSEGVKVTEWGPASEISIFLRFFGTYLLE